MQKVIYSQSFISFLFKSNCRIAKILYRLHKKRYVSNIINTDLVNYLTFRKDGNISFLPSGKEHLINDEGEWKKEGRQDGKPSKIIRKLFSAKGLKLFKDVDFESFCNEYKSNFCEDGYIFELLDNSEIGNVYDMERYGTDGSLNGSCMNGDSEYLEIYENCSQLKILILKNKEGLLCGRSLVWKIDEQITLLDRIYVSKDFMYESFLSYAKSAGYWTKKDFKSYDNKETFINPLGEVINRNFKIFTDTEFSQYPYIDTFQFGEDGYLTNLNYCMYTYNNTDGTRDGEVDDHEGESYDDFANEWINEDDAVYIESGESRYRGRTCHQDDAIYVNDSWYYKNDDNIVCINNTHYEVDSEDITTVNNDYVLIEDCTYCERLEEYQLSDDCVYCEDDEEDNLQDDCVEIDEKWYHRYSDKITKISGEYYLIDSEEVEIINGIYQLIEVEQEEIEAI